MGTTCRGITVFMQRSLHIYSTIFLIVIINLIGIRSKSVLAQDASQKNTDPITNVYNPDLSNGSTWLSLSLGEKISFLNGYKTACQDLVQTIQDRSTQPPRELNQIRLERKHIIQYLNKDLQQNQRQFIEFIDRFYVQRKNQNRPVSDAIEFAHRRIMKQ